jgi:hypothetical protein
MSPDEFDYAFDRYDEADCIEHAARERRRMAAICAEGIPSRPSPAGALAPVTPEQAARNRQLLKEAIGNRPSRRALLRALAPGGGR